MHYFGVKIVAKCSLLGYSIINKENFMDEKIKITIPERTLQTLKKDCTDFKITKENGQPNFNLFINTLTANYYEHFSANEESLHSEIRESLKLIPDRYKEDVFNNLVKIIAKNAEQNEVKEKSTTFSFKPTKISAKALVYIERILLKNEALSSFFRRMFTSYTLKTKNEREKIIHKDAYQTIIHAIEIGQEVCIETYKNTFLETVSIFSISPAKDELFNYILGFNGKNTITMRLASVKTVSLLPSRSFIPEKYEALLKRQRDIAPQYPMYTTDNEPIKVQLTENGKKMFEKVYLYRPTPTKIEGDIYTFECSANQLLYYFARFGDAALILSPKKLGINMFNHHHFALKKYKTLYGNHK
jgi:hypothetical protein